MMHWRFALAAGFVTLMLLAAGCPRCPEVLLSREELFAQYNANANHLRTLRANAEIELQTDHRGLYQSIWIPDGRLYFRRRVSDLGEPRSFMDWWLRPHPRFRGDDPLAPQDFVVRGKELGQELFRLGIDGKAEVLYYWANVPGRASFARWARLSDVEEGHITRLPINPVDILSLLGVVPWSTDMYAQTQVVLKAPSDACVYQMLVCSRREAWGGWYLTREVWLDRREDPPRPCKVLLYDRSGQVAMSAELRKYEPVETEGDPAARPMIPTDIRIRWPDAKGLRGIRLRLSAPRVETGVNGELMDKRFRMRIPDTITDRVGPDGPADETR